MQQIDWMNWKSQREDENNKAPAPQNLQNQQKPVCEGDPGPALWRKPVEDWLRASCRPQTRFSTSLKKLHNSFCDWSVSLDHPCTSEVFEQTLISMGYLIARIEGECLVSGVGFIEDIRSWEEYVKWDKAQRQIKDAA